MGFLVGWFGKGSCPAEHAFECIAAEMAKAMIITVMGLAIFIGFILVCQWAWAKARTHDGK
jgi:hypothetical protein